MKKLFTLFLLLVSYISFSQDYLEGPDLPNTGTGPLLNIQDGTNLFAGTLTTPADGQDRWQVYLPDTCQIDSVTYSISDVLSLGVSGFAQFGTGNQAITPPLTGSFATGPGGMPFPFTTSGTYDCMMVANIAATELWSVIFYNTCFTCTDPTIPTASADFSICEGDTAELDVLSGQLNDATDWYWYEGSCGSSGIGVGAPIYTNPTGTTTYYVRGEGGCATAGACDSVTVTVNTIDVGVTVAGTMLTADAVSATYQWVYCDSSFSGIPGETSQSYTATTNGNYAVIVTESGCTDTSACENISGIGFDDNEPFNTVQIFPNPVEFELNIISKYEDASNIQIIDLQGRVFSDQDYDQLANLSIDVSFLAEGIYYIKISDGLNEQLFKFIKE